MTCLSYTAMDISDLLRQFVTPLSVLAYNLFYCLHWSTQSTWLIGTVMYQCRMCRHCTWIMLSVRTYSYTSQQDMQFWYF